MLSGSSQARVQADWGAPDKILYAETGEIWVYENRQDGKTFQFHFDGKGRLLSSRIDKP
jgi:hypothetical protein